MKSGYRKFILLWVGELISSIGGGLTSFGLTVYVFNQTGSAASTSFIALLAFLPTLLLGIPAGVLADRFDRRLLMMIGDGLSALGLIYILICMKGGGALYYQICIGVTISAVFSALLEPAYKATVTDLLTEEEYVKASGLVGLAGSARYLLSPFLAGLLLAVTSIDTLLIIDICTFFLTVFVTSVVRKGIVETKVEDRTAAKASFVEDISVGWKTLTDNKGVLIMIMVASLMTFCMGAMQILAEPMILSFETSKTLGIAETICACGMLVTSILLGVFGLKKGILKALCLSLGAAGLFMIGFGISEKLIIIGISGFLFFAMIPIGNSGFDYLVRTNIPNELQGRAWGLIGFISQLGYVFAYALCGFAADRLARARNITVGRGSGYVIIISGIILAILSVILYFPKCVKNLEK